MRKELRVFKTGGTRGVPRVSLLCSLHGSELELINSRRVHGSLKRLSKRKRGLFAAPRAGRHLCAVRRERFPGHSRARGSPKAVTQPTPRQCSAMAFRPSAMPCGPVPWLPGAVVCAACVRCEHSRHGTCRLYCRYGFDYKFIDTRCAKGCPWSVTRSAPAQLCD